MSLISHYFLNFHHILSWKVANESWHCGEFKTLTYDDNNWTIKWIAMKFIGIIFLNKLLISLPWGWSAITVKMFTKILFYNLYFGFYTMSALICHLLWENITKNNEVMADQRQIGLNNWFTLLNRARYHTLIWPRLPTKKYLFGLKFWNE